MLYTEVKISESARLEVYIPSNFEAVDINRKRKTVLICPGGSYMYTSDREAEPVALKLVAEGFNAIVLRYSCFPATFPTALVELAKSIAMVRERCDEWFVDVDNIVVAGFSAGGHLAALIGTLWHTDFLEQQTGLDKKMYMPNGLMLGYPVVSADFFAKVKEFEAFTNHNEQHKQLVSADKNVTSHMPKTFMWHTDDDNVVAVENSLMLAIEMKKHKVSLELHIFPKGKHGLSLANEQTAKPADLEYVNVRCQVWFDMFIKWLQSL
ncbi:MAG: hypothetical protein BEN18_06670 [Epulopiscium sp. Nuni2H_MBin001]|nr:MAG: hypothetical protein BEN18_06670 [Epulopiscium sp. Nuni2H_MBin001]